MTKTTNIQPYHVLIAAAGSGQRMGADIPKQYIKIAGKTILRHTLDNVLSWPGLVSVRVIIDPQHANLYQDAVTGLDLADPIEGGKERKDSINKALSKLSDVKDDDVVLVHDAARPLVKWTDVSTLLEALRSEDVATLVVPVSDTLRHNETHADIDREMLYAVQTPQGFRYSDFKLAHSGAQPDKTYTDDVSLAQDIGLKVANVAGSRSNFKITTPDDLIMAEALLSSTLETRSGLGFDVHAFDKDASDKPLILCGIEVEHDYPLAGHSDADVGLHAITDALLGAIGAGDIGTHFPPSNPDFKDMDSAVFLEKAIELISEAGGSVQNLDLTLICEVPKIGPHQDAMKARVAEITGVDAGRISIKATTTEKLGFTGRGEGIAAQAIATVKVRGI